MIVSNKLPTHILWMLAVAIVTSIAFHGSRLPLWFPALALLTLSWRLLIDYFNRALPPTILRLMITAAVVLAMSLHYDGLLGKIEGIGLLSAMLCLKFLETSKTRDAFGLSMLCFFLSTTQFFFNQTFLLLGFILLNFVLISSCLIAIQNQSSIPLIRVRLVLAARLLLFGLPLALILFTLFPRLSSPLWGVSENENRAITGLSDSMSPGSFSEIIEDDSPIMRVEFEQTIPPPEERYWRGPVLWHYDGRKWTIDWGFSNVPADLRHNTQPDKVIRYQQTLLSSANKWLLPLGTPVSIPPNTSLSHDGQLTIDQNQSVTAGFQIESTNHRVSTSELSAYSKILALNLPQSYNPKTLKLGKKWKNSGLSPLEKINAALELFREKNFIYTLSPPPLGKHAMDEFLFDTQSGFCEHYASAFVILMRAAGVPSRIVTGFQGGLVNNEHNYILILNSNAHAWAESFIEGSGWIRVDPTQAVSPDRISRGISSAIPGTRGIMENPTLSWLQIEFDAFQRHWDDWVVGFSQDTQNRLMAAFNSNFNKQSFNLTLISIALLFITGIVYFARYDSTPIEPLTDLHNYWNRYCNKLEKAGCKKQHSEAALSYQRRAIRSFPKQKIEIENITKLFIRMNYANHSSKSLLSLFIKSINDLKIPK